MPRKYKLKFGGGEGVPQPMNTTPLIIGVILLVIILPIFGLIGYYGFYLERCQDKGDDDEYKITCPTGKKLTNKTCEADCDEGECCVEKTCNPPSVLPTGYTGTRSTHTLKSVTDFATPPSIDGVNCDTLNGYSEGNITAISCGSSDTWSYDGCSRNNNCLNGYNPDGYGNVLSNDRNVIDGCANVDLLRAGQVSDEQQQRECNLHYNNSTHKFCKWHDEIGDNCREGSPCTP